MENKLSQEAIKIIKILYKALLLTHERLADVVYASKDNYGEDIEELCEHYPWLRDRYLHHHLVVYLHHTQGCPFISFVPLLDRRS